MLYGVEDRLRDRAGYLSQYMSLPTQDVLWLTLVVHSHRPGAAAAYFDQQEGLCLNYGALLRPVSAAIDSRN